MASAFNDAMSQTNALVHYVMNKQEHHRVKTFREEYLEMLEKFEVPYDERYLFDFIDHDDVQRFLDVTPTEL